MKKMLSDGININNKIFKFKISQTVCDISAKACILNINKGHNV